VETFSLQGAKILLASHFDYEYMLGHKIVFVCVAKGTPQPQITWFKDGIELYAHSYLHVSMAHSKHYVVWETGISTLLPTNWTTQHHIPKHQYLPTRLYGVIPKQWHLPSRLKCHIPKHGHLPSRLQCHIPKHGHLPSTPCAATFLNSGSLPSPML
jgi:hypothetical protein